MRVTRQLRKADERDPGWQAGLDALETLDLGTADNLEADIWPNDVLDPRGQFVQLLALEILRSDL